MRRPVAEMMTETVVHVEAFNSYRREECVQMPAKIGRSAPRLPLGLPELTVAVRTSLLSCRKAGKTRIFTPVRESSGESRIQRASADIH